MPRSLDNEVEIIVLGFSPFNRRILA